MAENLDYVAAAAANLLLCTENTNTCFDDLDYNDVPAAAAAAIDDDDGDDDFGVSLFWHNQNPNFNNNIRSNSLMDFPLLSVDEIVKEMVEKEPDHLPRADYLKRLRSGDLNLRDRRDALDWILKAHAHYRFGALAVCLSMNYLDRFLSTYPLPSGKTWAVQLLAVACLSIASKMEETQVPQLVDLQVGEPKFVFEAKTIQRMELLVLTTLQWRMQSLTPCSFIDYFLTKINDDQQPSSTSISRSIQLILSTIKGIDFLEYKPSEIAAAVAISVSADIQPQDIHNAMSSCFIHVEKERVMKCVELIKDLSLISVVGNGNGNGNGVTGSSYVPQSPDGVLDAAMLSYKSSDVVVDITTTVVESSHNIKRRKTHHHHHNNNNIPSS